MDEIPARYSRNMNALSLQDQTVLSNSTVSIVGLGGLGGAVAEILARIGVGCLKLIDGDCFEEHNLNRQRFATSETIGISKARASENALHAVNSSITIQSYPVFLQEDNAIELISNSDVVADCLDSLKTRFILESACKKAGIPMVSAAVAGEYGHVSTIFPEDIGLRAIYGEPEFLEDRGAETSLGCLPYTVNLIASSESAEVVKILLGRGKLLRNKLLIADLRDNIIEVSELCG